MQFNWIILLILININLLTGQETENTLKEVVLKGRKSKEKEKILFKKNAQSTDFVGEYELNRNNPAFIEQSLNTVAGVQIDKRTQLGGQRIVIRGYGNDQKFNNWGIKTYFNNMPLSTADGVTILDDFNFSLLDNIEIIKGPASTLYGSGVGGTVKFKFNPNLKKGVVLEQKNTFGSFDLFQSNSRVTSKNDVSANILDFGYLESNGYRPHGASHKNFLSYINQYQLSKNEKVELFLSNNYSYELISGQISYGDYFIGIDPGNSAYIKKNTGNKIKSNRFGLTYENKFNENLDNTTTVFYYNSEIERIAAGAFEISKNPNFGIRSVFNWKNNISDKWKNEFVLGTELQQSTSLISNYRFVGTDDSQPLLVSNISRGSYFNNKNNQKAFFFENRVINKPADLTMLFGLSANEVQYSRKDLLSLPGLITNYNKDLSFNKKYDLIYNPHVAIQKNIANHLLNVSYSFGFNSPTTSTSFISALNSVNNELQTEKANMLDFSAQGFLFESKLDYKFSLYNMLVKDKLTQLSGINPQGGAVYNFWANTGEQLNRGVELSLGYKYDFRDNIIIKGVEPFFNYNYNKFKYEDFKTKFGNQIVDYSGNKVVGVPEYKCSVGLDIKFVKGIILQNTFNSIGSVYTDFANTNLVKGFEQLNSKLSFQKEVLNKKLLLDVYFAGNNLTNKINYAFLFLGNSVNDSDPGSNYPAGVATDVNPGPSKAYFFGGFGFKYSL